MRSGIAGPGRPVAAIGAAGRAGHALAATAQLAIGGSAASAGDVVRRRLFSSDAIVAANSGFGSSPRAGFGIGGGDRRAGAARSSGRFAQVAEVADLVDGQPVVEAFAPAVQLGFERLARDPRCASVSENGPLVAVDRDVPLLFERGRRLGQLRRERGAERTAGGAWLRGARRRRTAGAASGCARLVARRAMPSRTVMTFAQFLQRILRILPRTRSSPIE